MRSGTEVSATDIVFVGLGIIWSPGAEALKLQRDLNMRSLEDLSAVAVRAGYEICYVDLPSKVSGFATVIASKPHIVVNRAKSPQHQQYTIAHELGHQVLHVNPPQPPNQLSPQIKGMAEYQADMFAATLIFATTNDKEREDMLKQNPESFTITVSALLMSAVILVIALILYLCSGLSSARPSNVAERE
jgi:Zn-dependent peptidase ImmA (M78 family)